MISAFIALVVGVISFQTFTLNYQISGVKRTLINMPKSIVEVSVEKQVVSDVESFYINDETFEELSNYYFEVNLSKYVSSYTVSYSYYYADLNRVCIPTSTRLLGCDGVILTLNCKIMSLFDYEESMYFEIVEYTNFIWI